MSPEIYKKEMPHTALSFLIGLWLLLHLNSSKLLHHCSSLSTELNTQEIEQWKDYRRSEEQLRELSVTGSYRLSNKFTWIVTQKTTFAIDHVWWMTVLPNDYDC